MAGEFGDVYERVVAGADLDADDERMLELCRSVAEEPDTVALPDGRELGYADVGDPDGEPLVVFHGFPNSRVFGALFDAAGREHGRRVLAPERPGVGVSTPAPDRALTDWPADLDAFADALDLGSFPVFGVSGGGPYALAAGAHCARVERAGVAVGVGPMAAVGFRQRLPFLLARYLPPLVAFRLRRDMARARDDPGTQLESRVDDAAPVDAEYWRGAIGRALLLSGVEAVRHHGVDPLVTELAVYGRPWGFDLVEVDVPVHLWYGEADRIVPADMGHYLADRLPDADATFYPDLGHVSTAERNQQAIVEWLTRG